jgi:SOS response regulatory protein OraA/RecX
MSETYRPVVNHLTRIILKLIEEPVPYGEVAAAEAPTPMAVRRFGERLARRGERVAAMMDALAARGFTFKFEKDRVLADSNEVEAQEAKRYLISKGFEDTEFQVLLEYARKWGVL